MTEYLITVEYLINENVNIKRLDEKIESLLNSTNGKTIKSDIIYNTNKRYKILPKDIMFNNNILSFTKFIEMKKFINNLFKNVNNFDKKTIIKIPNITKYCSKKKVDDKELYNKFENNIIIANIEKNYTKYNKKKTDNLFSLKKINTNTETNKGIQKSLVSNKETHKETHKEVLTLENLLNLENLVFGNTESCEENNDKYKILKKYITQYYIKNNIIN